MRERATEDRPDQDVWAAAMDLVRTAVTDATWQLWLCDVEVFGRDDDGALMVVAPDHVASYIEWRYLPVLTQALDRVAPGTVLRVLTARQAASYAPLGPAREAAQVAALNAVRGRRRPRRRDDGEYQAA